MATARDNMAPSVPPVIFDDNAPVLGELRERMNALYLADETETVRALLEAARLPDDARARIQERATRLVEAVRANTGTSNCAE